MAPFKGYSKAETAIHNGCRGERGDRAAVFRSSHCTCVSVLIAIFCIVTGGIFLGKVIDGDRACRGLLGDTLWEGSSPKFVLVKDGGSLRGGCNVEGIRKISVSDDGTAPMVRLPPILLRLPQLESLVLLGHNIASDGVPVAMFEGVALPKLKHLQFGPNDPVNRTLDLSARRGRSLDAFPYHALQLMSGLESLQLGGQNISCFPDLKLLPGLRELRRLNLSGTTIRYLPPSVLFEHSQLEVDLSGTPVSESLDWSHHGLGSEFVWSRMATTLPLLTSLDLSWNGLEDANALNINLNDLQRLRRLDLSHNPDLTPVLADKFSWWQMLSEHPMLGKNASFVGLADVGLAPKHVDLETGGLTCDQLKWIRRVMHSTALGNALDLRGNKQFGTFNIGCPLIMTSCSVDVMPMLRNVQDKRESKRN